MPTSSPRVWCCWRRRRGRPRRRTSPDRCEAWTDHSVTDAGLVRQRLEDVRRAGFAWVFEEMSEGLNSVAAPVFNPAGNVIAAVSAHGPSYRFPAPGASASVAAFVVETAGRVTDRLAGRHRTPIPA